VWLGGENKERKKKREGCRPWKKRKRGEFFFLERKLCASMGVFRKKKKEKNGRKKTERLPPIEFSTFSRAEKNQEKKKLHHWR
jgi:hypothetical protein